MIARRPTQLPRWHERAIYIGFATLVVTGLAWLVLDQWVRVAGEFGPEHHPAERLALIVHGIAAYIFLLVLGALLPVHVKLGWSIGRNRSSGIVLGATMLVLAVTAIALYYVGGESLRTWSSTVHWVVGLAAIAVLAIHAIRGRGGTIRRRAGSPRRRGRPKPAG